MYMGNGIAYGSLVGPDGRESDLQALGFRCMVGLTASALFQITAGIAFGFTWSSLARPGLRGRVAAWVLAVTAALPCTILLLTISFRYLFVESTTQNPVVFLEMLTANLHSLVDTYGPTNTLPCRRFHRVPLASMAIFSQPIDTDCVKAGKLTQLGMLWSRTVPDFTASAWG
jgi:hypothetical protein